jgi:hypothetical protein
MPTRGPSKPAAATLEERCNTLKTEVKSLQNAFAKENGRKMGRDDIKSDAKFLAKWQEYENLSAIVKGKRVPHSNLDSTQAIMKKLEEHPWKRRVCFQ